MRIAIGSDHRGFAHKQTLLEHLRQLGHEVLDCGCPGPEAAAC
jgi:ribose 5-phosphate isomerase B